MVQKPLSHRVSTVGWAFLPVALAEMVQKPLGHRVGLLREFYATQPVVASRTYRIICMSFGGIA